MVSKRLKVKAKLEDMLARIKDEYPNASVSFEEDDSEDIYKLKLGGDKFKIELFRVSLETTYFNALTTVSLAEEGSIYEFRSSEVPFDLMDEELDSVRHIIESVIKKQYKIIQKRELFIFRNEYMVINNNDLIHLLKVR